MQELAQVLGTDEIPPRLREIPDPPKRLFVRGRLPSPEAPVLCVVGARKHTEYGRAATERLIEGLRGSGICVVSGLALGIDGIAHRAALRAGLATIAVPGSGLDPQVLYPRSHYRLAEEIVAQGGALVSEYESKTPAAPWTFPRRNRIMAGLSDAVLLVEAETKSGTLITARLAADYNRDVLAVPGSIFSRLSEGPNLFLRLGATPVRSADDILDAFGLKKEDAPRPTLFDLSPDEQKVVDALAEPLPRDELVAALAMPVSDANILLSAMELKGIITESMGEVRLA